MRRRRRRVAPPSTRWSPFGIKTEGPDQTNPQFPNGPNVLRTCSQFNLSDQNPKYEIDYYDLNLLYDHMNL